MHLNVRKVKISVEDSPVRRNNSDYSPVASPDPKQVSGKEMHKKLADFRGKLMPAMRKDLDKILNWHKSNSKKDIKLNKVESSYHTSEMMDEFGTPNIVTREKDDVTQQKKSQFNVESPP